MSRAYNDNEIFHLRAGLESIRRQTIAKIEDRHMASLAGDVVRQRFITEELTELHEASRQVRAEIAKRRAIEPSPSTKVEQLWDERLQAIAHGDAERAVQCWEDLSAP